MSESRPVEAAFRHLSKNPSFKKGPHVSPAVGDAVDVNAFVDDLIYYPVGFEMDFRIFLYSNRVQFRGYMPPVGMFSQTQTQFFQSVKDMICVLHRIMTGDVVIKIQNILFRFICNFYLVFHPW
jgi:hypothetical protein